MGARCVSSSLGLKILSLATGVVGLGAAAGVILQNESFAELLITFYLGLTLLLMLLVAGFALLISCLAGWFGKKIILGATVLIFSAFMGTIAFCLVGAGINRWKIAAVESYVASATSQLDQMKAHNGAYPRGLPVAVLGDSPYLLRTSGDYSSDGQHFYFEYDNGIELVRFDSSDRIWH